MVTNDANDKTGILTHVMSERIYFDLPRANITGHNYQLFKIRSNSKHASPWKTIRKMFEKWQQCKVASNCAYIPKAVNCNPFCTNLWRSITNHQTNRPHKA